MQSQDSGFHLSKREIPKALDELEKFVVKRKQLVDKWILEAYHESDKIADEIIAFVLSKEGGTIMLKT